MKNISEVLIRAKHGGANGAVIRGNYVNVLRWALDDPDVAPREDADRGKAAQIKIMNAEKIIVLPKTLN